MKSVVLAVALLLAASSALADQVVAEFSGDGGIGTSPFTVTGPWELRYTSGAGAFIARATPVEPGRGGFAFVAVNVLGPSAGASYRTETGTFTLEIIARSAWTITIVEITPTAPPAP